MSKYSIEAIDPAARNTSHVLALELVGDAASVLDVGCATGYFGAALQRDGRTVTGVEIDPEAAAEARAKLDEVVVADIATTPLDELFAGRQFEAIVFGDVLEHLVDPETALKSALKVLAPGGAVVISVPNVTHGSVRLALLQGRWRYMETGLLDNTHVHFFAREAVIELVHAAGLRMTDFFSTMLDPLDAEVQVDPFGLPGSVIDWVRHQQDARTYQFVLRAVPGTAGEAGVPEALEPLPPIEFPMPDDVHTRRARREAQEAEDMRDWRLERLRYRDAIIGLKASLARSEAALARAEHEQNEILVELVKARSSRTWRAGRMVTFPLRLARAAARAAR